MCKQQCFESLVKVLHMKYANFCSSLVPKVPNAIYQTIAEKLCFKNSIGFLGRKLIQHIQNSKKLQKIACEKSTFLQFFEFFDNFYLEIYPWTLYKNESWEFSLSNDTKISARSLFYKKLWFFEVYVSLFERVSTLRGHPEFFFH
jgi:hypothetical protein